MSTLDSTSRQVLGVGNLGNIYRAKPTPPEPEAIPIYINDELEALGGRLNNLLQGGVFPPVSEMPTREKEGTCLLFTQSVRDENGNVVIPSSGLYIFFKNKWNKISLTPV